MEAEQIAGARMLIDSKNQGEADNDSYLAEEPLPNVPTTTIPKRRLSCISYDSGIIAGPVLVAAN